jgi:hypothetical protein
VPEGCGLRPRGRDGHEAAATGAVADAVPPVPQPQDDMIGLLQLLAVRASIDLYQRVCCVRSSRRGSS